MIEQEMAHEAECVIADRQFYELRAVKLFFVPAKRDDVRYRLAEFSIQQPVICQRVADLVLRDGLKAMSSSRIGPSPVHSLLR